MNSSSKKKLLHLIKLLIEIKSHEDDQVLRKEYLSQFQRFLEIGKEQFVRSDLALFKKEFQRFVKYAVLKWGKGSKLYLLATEIFQKIEAIEATAPDKEYGELSELCSKWETANAIYRPDHHKMLVKKP